MSERTIEQIREDNETRLRRAGAWIEKAESVTDDTSKFIFYWIAFNAQYSRRGDSEETDEKASNERDEFLIDIFYNDKDYYLVDIINDNQDALKIIFELPQTYKYFWNEPKKENIENMEQWRKYFSEKTQNVFSEEGLNRMNIKNILKLIFNRLNVVRNQIFHGSHSGSWESHGYTQVEKGAELLSKFVPCFFRIMEISINKNPDEYRDWGAVSYRPQGNPDDKDCLPPWLNDKK